MPRPKLVKNNPTGQKIKCFLCARFYEPSTWAAIGATIGVLGGQIDKPAATYAFVFAALCGIAAILLKDGGGDANSG